MSTAWVRIIGDRRVRPGNGERQGLSWWPGEPPIRKFKYVHPKGKVKVQFKDIFNPGEGRGQCVILRGGPLDNETIATHLYVKTGRGKATAHISVPLMPDTFDVTTDVERGHYAWNDEAHAYWWVDGQLEPMTLDQESMPDQPFSDQRYS